MYVIKSKQINSPQTRREILLDAIKKVETIQRLKTARQRVRSEIQDLTERLRVTQENIKRVRGHAHSGATLNTSTHENIKREIID